MSVATAETNAEVLVREGIYLEHLDKKDLIALNNMPPEEILILIGLKRRFNGGFPAEPAMFEGSDQF